MSEAPERIRVWPDYDDHFSPARHDWTGGIWDDTDDASGIEYIRADLSQAAVEALEAKLAEAVEYLGKDQLRINHVVSKASFKTGGESMAMQTWADGWRHEAISTLAELTGGKEDTIGKVSRDD